ncbi:MAG: glycerol-3-phosphate acyltransferase [Desulfobacteraceae bacterium]|nr:MAG: glycerol-3-phosphate acyltransferase [Desulfobacteraceae bacterium]
MHLREDQVFMEMSATMGTASLVRLAWVLPVAYLAGSLNFSILLFRLLGKEDPRKHFSGNPGVTNVYRQAGWPAAALVLVLDMGRAAAVALLARSCLAEPLVPWAGWAMILGNHFPCLHGFKGGKGVANFLGFCAVLLPLGTLVSLGAYLMVFALVRIPFLASFGMLAVLTAFGVRLWWPDPLGVAALLTTAGSIVWFHRSNIAGWVADRKKRGKPDAA